MGLDLGGAFCAPVRGSKCLANCSPRTCHGKLRQASFGREAQRIVVDLVSWLDSAMPSMELYSDHVVQLRDLLGRAADDTIASMCVEAQEVFVVVREALWPANLLQTKRSHICDRETGCLA